MSDVIRAAGIEVRNCDQDCDCQLVHILLTDEDREPIAGTSWPTAMARKIAGDIMAAADDADLRQAQLDGRVS